MHGAKHSCLLLHLFSGPHGWAMAATPEGDWCGLKLRPCACATAVQHAAFSRWCFGKRNQLPLTAIWNWEQEHSHTLVLQGHVSMHFHQCLVLESMSVYSSHPPDPASRPHPAQNNDCARLSSTLQQPSPLPAPVLAQLPRAPPGRPGTPVAAPSTRPSSWAWLHAVRGAPAAWQQWLRLHQQS